MRYLGEAPGPLPVVSVGSVTVSETFARGDWVPALVPVTLDRAAAERVTVTFTTGDATARSGAPDRDYQPRSGTVTIPAGQRSVMIWTYVVGDAQPETDEHYAVTLTGATGATLGALDGRVTIRDRAQAGMVVADTTVVETDDSPAALVVATISLSERHAEDVAVDWTTAELPPQPPGAAFNGAEYLDRVGTAVIPAGQLHARVSLWVRGDVADEIDESFHLVVDPASTTVPVVDDTGIITLANNDVPDWTGPS